MKKKHGNILYTILVLSALVAITVFLVSRKKVTDEIKTTQDIKVKIAPEKQLVKPDDIIEESIIGDSDQPIVGNGTIVV